MSKSIRPVRVNHVNVVLEDYDASVGHLQELYGAQFLLDLPQPMWHACLIDIGRVIFEVFAPHDFFLNSRYGPHHFGIEYQADMEEVREALAERGIRIIRELGVACHVHPADCHGIAFEFYEGFFHDSDRLTGGPMKSAEHWRDEHPLGLTGLKAYTVAVRDLAQARSFFEGLFHHEVVYEVDRPTVAARAVGLQVADAVLELVTPTGDGPMQHHLETAGEGIRSTVFGVRDLDQARGYFRDRGVELVAGGAPDTLAIPAERNRGVRFEFSE